MPPERPLAAAALRIAVVLLLFVATEPRDAIDAARSHAPRVAPEGLGWLVGVLPLRPDVLSVAARVHQTAAALALVGVFTRPALAILLGTTFLLFAAAQLSGAVAHDMHLLWFLALLCASSAPERALSVDAWLAHPTAPWRRRLFGPVGADAESGLTLFFCRTLLGLVYFFPGLWKLRASGLDWAFSDNLANVMHGKWLEFGAVPSPRIDRAPALLHAMGLFTLVFELSFVVLVHAGRRTRAALAAVGLAFHLGIEHFLFIPFASLWGTYVMLLPLPPEATEPPSRSGGRRFVGVVGCILVAGAAVQGARGHTQAFPFACYPTFQEIAGPGLPDLVLTAVADDGAARIVPHGRDELGRRSQREWGTVWSVAGIYGSPYDERRLRAYLDSERRRSGVREALAGARRVQVRVVERLTDPAAWDTPPRPLLDRPPITLDER